MVLMARLLLRLALLVTILKLSTCLYAPADRVLDVIEHGGTPLQAETLSEAETARIEAERLLVTVNNHNGTEAG